MAYTISKALILAVVDVVVMDVVSLGGYQVNTCMGETGDLTVIHFEPGVSGRYAV